MHGNIHQGQEDLEALGYRERPSPQKARGEGCGPMTEPLSRHKIS